MLSYPPCDLSRRVMSMTALSKLAIRQFSVICFKVVGTTKTHHFVRQGRWLGHHPQPALYLVMALDEWQYHALHPFTPSVLFKDDTRHNAFGSRTQSTRTHQTCGNGSNNNFWVYLFTVCIRWGWIADKTEGHDQLWLLNCRL